VNGSVRHWRAFSKSGVSTHILAERACSRGHKRRSVKVARRRFAILGTRRSCGVLLGHTGVCVLGTKYFGVIAGSVLDEEASATDAEG
jgi:hypothetical protein